MDDGTREGAANGADGGTVCGVDDADGVAFEFCCVCHDDRMPPPVSITSVTPRACVIADSSVRLNLPPSEGIGGNSNFVMTQAAELPT